MARFRDIVGFVNSIEISPGVFEDRCMERTYSGDIIKSSMKWDSVSEVNESVGISNRISIVADSYAKSNMWCMRYILLNKKPYEITSIEESDRRLILTIGGVYNGPRKTIEIA